MYFWLKSPVFNSNQGISERYWYYYRGPIICGGNQLGEVSNDCYALYNDAVNSTSDQYQIDWWPTLSMLEPRIHAASVQILEAGLTSQYNWWVSGGQDKNLDILKSTEIRWSHYREVLRWGVFNGARHNCFSVDIFFLISYTFDTSKCASNYIISFEVYDGFIGQKILKLWRQENWPCGPNAAQISIPVP